MCTGVSAEPFLLSGTVVYPIDSGQKRLRNDRKLYKRPRHAADELLTMARARAENAFVGFVARASCTRAPKRQIRT